MKACQQWISSHEIHIQKLVSFKMFPNLVANYALHYFRDDGKERYGPIVGWILFVLSFVLDLNGVGVLYLGVFASVS